MRQKQSNGGMDTSRRAIGLRIRALRGELGLNQRAFAQELAISNKTLSSYENGDAYPSLDVFVRIVLAGGKTFDWLLFGVDMPKVDQEKISDQEIRLLQLFRQAAEADKEMLLRMAEMAAKSKKKSVEKK